MSKKITDENGNTYVQKKPFYKRVWFIVLVALFIVIGAVSTMGGGKDDSATKVPNSKASSSSSSKTTVADKTFKVGDTIKADGVTLKVNKVEFNDGSSASKPDTGKSYVIVNVTITNVDKDKIDYNPYDFKLDDKGNQTDLSEFSIMDDNYEEIVNDQLQSGSLTKGASVTGTMIGQAVKTDKLKLLYHGNLFSDKATITFDLN